MPNTVTLEELEHLAAQLPPEERLKLAAHICEQLSAAVIYPEAGQMKDMRLGLAEELLAECDEIEDDSQGKFDAAHDIRQMRAARAK
ncbi:MAG: hypothetical protein HYW07_04270 [Candidatus Latescibacteria bacterium]|nr:hypothetical protein [Candidatus Latescibacterota bacterium]